MSSSRSTWLSSHAPNDTAGAGPASWIFSCLRSAMSKQSGRIRSTCCRSSSIDGVVMPPSRTGRAAHQPFQGWLGKRLTRSFGYEYDFDNRRFDPGDPLPDWLLDLRSTLARYCAIPADQLVQALLIRYDISAGIGWHLDRPVFKHVVGLSLGNVATLRFRRRTTTGFQRFNLNMSPCSLYRLSGEARYDWEHSIAEMSMPRWSITFRTLADRPRQAT
jgi:DNA oxidative demethylase